MTPSGVISRRIGVERFVRPLDRAVISLGPFAGVVGASVELDFLGEETVRAAFQFNAVAVTDRMHGRARELGEGAVLEIRLNPRPGVGEDVRFDEITVGADAFAALVSKVRTDPFPDPFPFPTGVRGQCLQEMASKKYAI